VVANQELYLLLHKDLDKLKRRRVWNTGIIEPFAVVESPEYRVFSHDVTAAILVSQNNETATMLVSQTNPVGVELFSYANAFFCSNKFA